jgi:alkanesulfonate monooxygenase SsuD/methylene tetrahydromethanopterin reductase-like flavin-dependent oxidoreductase (luciferase family)
MDYGHPLDFGYFLIPDAADPQGVLETARLADRLGYDLLAIQDHPYQPAHLDALALVA